MAEDVWEYFDQRRRECRDLSVAEGDLDYYEEEGSGGQWGHVVGNITLSDDAYLSVHEVVRVEDGHAHREEYGYFLVIEGVEIWGEERDPVHDPPVHRHGRGHERYDAEPIAFKAAVELAWATVSQGVEHGLNDIDPMHP